MKALLIIDIQKGLTKRDLYKKAEFISAVNSAISKAREKGYIVVFVQHENNQLIAGTEDWEIDSRLLKQDTDDIFPKNKGDAFSNPDLVEYLSNNSIDAVAVAGLVTHGCVNHTCLGGIKKGYAVSLIKEGHTCWNKDANDKILSTETSLSESGIKIIEPDEL